jgi:ankyrin repeat protein
VSKLLQHRNINVNPIDDFELWTLLHNACRYDHLPAVQWQLHHPNIQVNSRDCDQCTPLHCICNGTHYRARTIVRELLSHPHIDVMAMDQNGLIPLHRTCQEGNEGLFEM